MKKLKLPRAVKRVIVLAPDHEETVYKAKDSKREDEQMLSPLHQLVTAIGEAQRKGVADALSFSRNPEARKSSGWLKGVGRNLRKANRLAAKLMRKSRQ